jgi:predicted TIM-barrel fold metal-dependent hydrolase
VYQSRREFLRVSALATMSLGASIGADAQEPLEPIIDIHQHLGYSGRSDEAFLAHQQNMEISRTILLPAGRPVNTPSTHDGKSNGLDAQALGNQACYRFAHQRGRGFMFAANEVPDLRDATNEIERYLKRGAVAIAEQKFGIDCDSTAMQRIYDVARAHHVPVLMHWQHGMYNYGFDRFHRMLERYHGVSFIGHAQTWWANIDAKADQSVMYPKGPVTRGGLTDRYLTDYPNMFGDLSAGSGLNALTRDEAFARDFVARHQDKLIFGSDCSDREGTGTSCLGAQIIAAVRQLSASKAVERKLLHGNAVRVFRLSPGGGRGPERGALRRP